MLLARVEVEKCVEEDNRDANAAPAAASTEMHHGSSVRKEALPGTARGLVDQGMLHP